MAGIGFELRKLIKKQSLMSIIRVYSYSAVLSAGPWLASIIAISMIGHLSADYSKVTATKFQVAVTYLFAFSLIFSGILQLPFVRYVADRLYEKDNARIIPNFGGVLIIVMGVGLLIMFPLSNYLLREEGLFFRMLFASSFVTLCGIWIGNLLLTGVRRYRVIILFYVLSYGAMVLLSFFLRRYGLEGLMASFLGGSAILFCGFASIIYYNYPTDRLVEFDFLSKGKFFYSLMYIGFLYNVGIWIDKFIFWYHPLTGSPVVGDLSASVIYDLPIFLSYLLVTPGIAIFFYRYEADFMTSYALTGAAINGGGTLGDIEKYKGDMVESVRLALGEVVIVQGIIDVFLFISIPPIFKYLGIPQLYVPILYIDLIGTQLLLCFMITFSILLCLDCRKEAAFLSLCFVLSNAAFSYFSILLGPYFYGYGLALSSLVSGLTGIVMLRKHTDSLEYKTFMLRSQ